MPSLRLAGALAAASLAAAVPAAAASPAIVLKAARLFDGKADRVVTPGLLVVADGKIVSVSGTAPAGASVIDLGDATLLPGFIDAHTHLSMQMGDDYRHDELDTLQKTVAERTLDAVELVRRTLRAGFTTCRDLGASDSIDIGLRNAIRNGKIEGPRLLVARRAIGAPGGHVDPTAGFRPGLFSAGVEEGVVTGADQARAAVRINVKFGADVIKTSPTGGVLSLTDDVDAPQMTQAELDALVDEAHSLRRKVAAHAHGAEGAKRAIRAGVDSIEHGTFLDDEALDMMKKKGTFLVPTLMAHVGLKEMLEKGKIPPAIAAKARNAIAHVAETFRKALAKGVRVALGTDAGVYAHGRNAEEFHEMVALGMKPVDALRAGTSVDSELLGLADRIGSLEPGKLADVVAVPGDPTQEIFQTEKVFFVMRDGKVVRYDRAGTR